MATKVLYDLSDFIIIILTFISSKINKGAAA